MVTVNIKKKLREGTFAETLNVSTSFKSAAITQIFGPSGSGKTTFLKILAGLVAPDEGSVMVNRKTWNDVKSKINFPVQKRGVGFVFQDYALFSHMTVRQHLQYGCKDPSYIARLLKIGRMTGFEEYRPGQLSGGQQQRLAILRALSTKPGLLLMDEPFSALDNVLKNALIADLKLLLNELGTTCLIVTHQPLEESSFADFSFELKP